MAKATYSKLFQAQKVLSAMNVTSGGTFAKTPQGLEMLEHMNFISTNITRQYERAIKRIRNKFAATDEKGLAIIDDQGRVSIRKQDLDKCDDEIAKMEETTIFHFDALVLDGCGTDHLEPFVRFTGNKVDEDVALFNSLKHEQENRKDVQGQKKNDKKTTVKSDIVGPRENDRK